MAFSKLLNFTKTVSDLADKPALTPTALKAQFDSSPNELKDAFNTLIDALVKTTAGDSGAKNIGATAISGLTGSDVQTQIESLKTASDAKIVGAGQRMEIYDGLFFTNGSLNNATTSITFSSAFISPPTVTPGNVKYAVNYIDTIGHPYIYNITTTGFSVKIFSPSGMLGTATPENAIMSFVVIGK